MKTSRIVPNPDDGGLLDALGKLTISAEQRNSVRRVIANPTGAWKSEPSERKRAFLAQHPVADMPEPGAMSAQDVDSSLERIIQDNDILPLLWVREAARCADAVARIELAEAHRASHEEASSFATGFLVSPWLLMTNHHVFPSRAAASASKVRFRYEEDADGAISPVAAACDPRRFFLTDPRLDYTLVALKPLADGADPGATFGRLPLDPTIGKAIAGSLLNIVQHPAGRPKSIAFRNGTLAEVYDDGSMTYTADTMPGSSGSPVLNDEWQLVALHRSGFELRNERGEPIEKLGKPTAPSTPEHLRAWVANLGTRVSALVADLRERLPGLPDDERVLLAEALPPREA